jgi:hypothetical protein
VSDVAFSIEAVIVGRNDNYEPNWENNLFSAIAYNRALFEGTSVEYRVAFVEWNPLPNAPFLAPRLVERFPFVRGIVVDPEIHQALCEVDDLPMLLTYAFNAGFRTTGADYCLGSCGDIFYSTALSETIVREGLRTACLYRAERASIRNDLPFAQATAAAIELPANIVGVDTCSEPPYDQPPYTNAAGDFSMLDAGTMFGLRGYDEGVTYARLHIDARFGLAAMSVVNDCRLLGRIFHVSHAKSHSNPTSRAAGRIYDYTANLPYLNSPAWGLANYDWHEQGQRLFHVRLPVGEAVHAIPDYLPAAAREAAVSTHSRVLAARNRNRPDAPIGATTVVLDLFENVVDPSPEWGSTLEAEGSALHLRTSARQWAYSSMFHLSGMPELDEGRDYWIAVKLSVTAGALGVALLKDSALLVERFAESSDAAVTVFVPLVDAGSEYVVLRNVDDRSASVATIYSAHVVSQMRSYGVPDVSAGEPLYKLHLACGRRFIPGFIHIDNVLFDHVDHVQDIRRLQQFPDESAGLIYASQVLTYFDREEVGAILAEWRRVLAPGGTLRLSVINFEVLARLYQTELPIERLLGSLYGKMSDGNGGFIYMRTTYDEPSMTRILQDAGFDTIERWDWRQTEHRDVDDFSQAYYPHMEKDHGLLMNLNIQAKRTIGV